MSQSRLWSAVESAVVTVTGLAYAVPINWAFIRFEMSMDPWLRAWVLTVLFTVLGFLVKYLTRRIFNSLGD
jgi:hypothetical protein